MKIKLELEVTANYWQVLGIEPTRDQDKIKEAYRERAKIMHPDKSTGSTEKFNELNNAYNKALKY